MAAHFKFLNTITVKAGIGDQRRLLVKLLFCPFIVLNQFWPLLGQKTKVSCKKTRPENGVNWFDKNRQWVSFTVGILKNSAIPVGKLDGFSYLLLTSTLTLLMSVSTGLIKIDNVLFIQRT